MPRPREAWAASDRVRPVLRVARGCFHRHRRSSSSTGPSRPSSWLSVDPARRPSQRVYRCAARARALARWDSLHVDERRIAESAANFGGSSRSTGPIARRPFTRHRAARSRISRATTLTKRGRVSRAHAMRQELRSRIPIESLWKRFPISTSNERRDAGEIQAHASQTSDEIGLRFASTGTRSRSSGRAWFVAYGGQYGGFQYKQWTRAIERGNRAE